MTTCACYLFAVINIKTDNVIMQELYDNTINDVINDDDALPPGVDKELGSYLTQLTKTPLLTAREEKTLARKIQRGGMEGMRAKDKMVESNMRLVFSIARQYLSIGLPLEDLIQEGAIGLMTAAERFDPVVGTKFSTYATHWVRQAIGRAVDNKAKMIRLPAHVSESMRKVDRARHDLAEEGITEPSQVQISETSGLSVRKINNLREAGGDPLSLDYTIIHKEGTLGHSLQNVLHTGAQFNPSTIMQENALKHDIKGILSVLDKREQLIMSRRFGVSDEDEDEIGSVLARTADDLGISRERVRTVETSALKKLRSAARNQRLKEKSAR